MRRVVRRLVLAGLPALVASGCSEPAPPAVAPEAIVHLSPENPDANAPAIAAFFRQTCLDASGDPGVFAAALQGSGWGHEQTQAASSAMPIAAWRLDHGELVRSALSLAPGASFIDCQLTLDPEVAPSVERMRDALRPLVRHASLRVISAGPPQVKWQWQPGPREERDLTIGVIAAGQVGNRMAGRPGLTIHFGASEAAPLPPIPAGTENVQ